MLCPFCTNPETQVVNSRSTKAASSIWRRRRCLRCQKVFTTYENIDLSHLQIQKKKGLSEPYMRSKLLLSIYRASENLDNQLMTADALVDTIERAIIAIAKDSINSSQIAEIAAKVLNRYSESAALRYLTYQSDVKSTKELLRRLG